MVRTMVLQTLMMIVLLLSWQECARAAGVRVVPSSTQVAPGDDFYLDVIAENIPAEGLGGMQFRLNISLPGGVITSADNLSQAGPGGVTVASPLRLAPPTAVSSGIGEFFWNGRGPSGILAIENESFVNGSALFTLAHTSGAIPPVGSGTVVRFVAHVGSEVKAGQVAVSLGDVMLLDGGPAYPLEYALGAAIVIPCLTKVPQLVGLSAVQVREALATANLQVGTIYKVTDFNGKLPLNTVLEQSLAEGSRQACATSINIALNTPPAEVTQAAAADKVGDESGAVQLTWMSTPATDVIGYRIYNGATLLKELVDAAATGTVIERLPLNRTTLLRITVYDRFGLESPGVTVAALPLDDLPPDVMITGMPASHDNLKSGSFTFSSRDATASFECKLDTVVFAPCTSPYSYTDLADSSHLFSVRAKDLAGNMSTAAVYNWSITSAPPELSIAAPVNNTLTTNATLKVSGTVTAVGGLLSLTINGQAVTVSGAGGFTHALTLVEGVNTVSIVATNNANQVTTETRTIILDTVKPDLIVSTLSTGAATNQTPLNISGTVNDANGIASLTINGSAVTVTSGSYSYALPLAIEGPIDITIIATDNAGNSSTDSRTITFDTTLPTITVDTPAGNSQTKDAPLVVSGTISEDGNVLLRNATANLSQNAAVTGRNFTGSIQLVGGSNSIEVRVTDNAGNNSSAVGRTVFYDPNSPDLAILDPVHDIQVRNPVVTIKGAVTDQTSTVVNLNFNGFDYPQTVSAGQFQHTATIPEEGQYRITVTATDAVGNLPARATRNIIYTPYPGDMDGDGEVGLAEVLKAFQYAVGQTSLTPTEILRLDCAPLGTDGKPKPNGVIDTGDVILLLRRLVGLVSW